MDPLASRVAFPDLHDRFGGDVRRVACLRVGDVIVAGSALLLVVGIMRVIRTGPYVIPVHGDDKTSEYVPYSVTLLGLLNMSNFIDTTAAVRSYYYPGHEEVHVLSWAQDTQGGG